MDRDVLLTTGRRHQWPGGLAGIVVAALLLAGCRGSTEATKTGTEPTAKEAYFACIDDQPFPGAAPENALATCRHLLPSRDDYNTEHEGCLRLYEPYLTEDATLAQRLDNPLCESYWLFDN